MIERRVFLTVILAVTALAARPAFPAASLRGWILDGCGPSSCAFYPGPGIRSAIDAKFTVSSLAALERRAGGLPAGTEIRWPLYKFNDRLFGLAAGRQEFADFCRAHGMTLRIVPPACNADADCGIYCQGAGSGKECRPDGLPLCGRDRRCDCTLTCR